MRPAEIAIIGAPIALYGWLHRLIPYALIKWASRKFTMPDRRKAQASTTAIAAGVVGFGVCYAVYIAVFQRLFGWPASLWYALSLPVSGLRCLSDCAISAPRCLRASPV